MIKMKLVAALAAVALGVAGDGVAGPQAPPGQPDLVTQIVAAAQHASGNTEMRVGIVRSVLAGIISVQIAGSPQVVQTGYVSSYLPAAGDTVIMLKQDAQWLVLGNLGTTPGQLTIRDTKGNIVAEVGLLDDGTYGIAVVQNGVLVALSQIAFGPATAGVTAFESTSSTSYTNLTTPGPAVTAVIGPSGKAIVTVSTTIIGTAPNTAAASFGVSGASSVAASDANAVLVQVPGAAPFTFSGSRTKLLTGLTPGSNTFTMQYRVSAGSATFGNREIVVQPY